MLFILLIIYAYTPLAILKCKQILELKYQATHETTLSNQELEQGRSTVEKLQQQVKKYWIMVETDNPWFLIACSVTSCASGVAYNYFVAPGSLSDARESGLVLTRNPNCPYFTGATQKETLEIHL